MKKTFNKRAIASLTLLFTTIMLPISVWIAHATHGTAASYTWLHIHGVLGLMFIVSVVFHIIYNWRPLMRHLGQKK